MAKRLLDQEIKIDAFVSSPATRAKETAGYFAAAYHYPAKNILLISALYHAPSEVFFEVIGELDNSIEHAAVFAHNPGITHFVNQLVPAVQINNMPTCGVYALRVDTESWQNFSKAKKEFLFFDYPKNG